MDTIQHGRKKFDPKLLQSLSYLDATATEHYAPIPKRSYYQYIKEGKLRAFRIGGTGKLVVKREDLDRFLTATPVEVRLNPLVDGAAIKLK